MKGDSITIKLLDVVALLVDRPQEALAVGQVGTVVEIHPSGALEVEFLDSRGCTLAIIPVPKSAVLLLRHEPMAAAS